ncbi:AraC family transcriptional regulator, partial [Paenibacillus sepulcri]|nr:AraC family transcriptional regulator [Paenibacillus sepulcri]
MLKPDTAPSNKGILNAESGMRSFSLSRLLPGQDLAPYIEHLWILRWDLRGQAPHSQTVLSFPSIQLAFERTGQRIETFLYGVPDTTFTRVLEGEGQVLGVKFRIGGFYPFWNQPVSSLTNQVIPFREIFGSGPGMLEERLFSEAKEEEQAWIAWEFLRERLPEPDGNVELVNRIVAAIIGDREMVRVEDIVSLFGINKRTLQRLFSRYVGVSPKWVIQR